MAFTEIFELSEKRMVMKFFWEFFLIGKFVYNIFKQFYFKSSLDS